MLQKECVQAVAMELLLLLKSHIKHSFGLSDARCQVFFTKNPKSHNLGCEAFALTLSVFLNVTFLKYFQPASISYAVLPAKWANLKDRGYLQKGPEGIWLFTSASKTCRNHERSHAAVYGTSWLAEPEIGLCSLDSFFSSFLTIVCCFLFLFLLFWTKFRCLLDFLPESD